MCDKKKSSIVYARQASVERIAELITTAETELASVITLKPATCGHFKTGHLDGLRRDCFTVP
jgi:hypothetical protein